MKAPICSVCLNSNILCTACKKKMEEGEVSDSDLKISRIINDVAKKFKPLGDVEIKKVFEGSNLAVIICKKGDGPRLVGKNGVTQELVSSTRQALSARELIKVRFNEHKAEKKQLSVRIAEQTQSLLVDIIGHIAIIFRPHPDPEKRAITLPS